MPIFTKQSQAMNTKNPLVSIIIPTYNRAHLIAETLDSLLAQTHHNWECIIVDDGSTDNTNEVVQIYLDKDARFHYYHRPAKKTKGANACRNYGFEVSKGEYVNWFDSDDLMLESNIEEKLNGFTNSIDFVISNSQNFTEKGIIGRPFNLNYQIPITAENFITHKIGWITNDVMLRRKSVLILFDETLISGQEYIFFSKLLFYRINGKYLKKTLAKRRVHPDSIQEQLVSKNLKELHWYLNELALLRATEKKMSKKLINRSLKRLVRFSFNLTKSFSINLKQIKILGLLFKFKKFKDCFMYFSWMIFNLFTGRGYVFIRNIYLSLKWD